MQPRLQTVHRIETTPAPLALSEYNVEGIAPSYNPSRRPIRPKMTHLWPKIKPDRDEKEIEGAAIITRLVRDYLRLEQEHAAVDQLAQAYPAS